MFLTSVLNSQGMKKLRYAIQKSIKKSSWNEPYFSFSFTKQSCIIIIIIIITIIIIHGLATSAGSG